MTGDRFRNRFFRFGHNGFFCDAEGTPSERFMQMYWLPLLRGSGPIPVHEEREQNTGFRQRALVVLSPLSWVKHVFYLALLAVAVLLPVYLHVRGERERPFRLSSETRISDPTESFLYAAA